MEKKSNYKVILERDDDNMMSLQFLKDGELIEDFSKLGEADINTLRVRLYKSDIFLNHFTE